VLAALGPDGILINMARGSRSPIALECIYNKTIDLVCSNGKKTVNSLVIGDCRRRSRNRRCGR
jgi:hypothetical protein